MGRKATVVRTETTTDDAREEGEDLAKHLDVALFSNLGSTEDDTIDKIHILRMDPDEGYLGYMEATATEYDVFQRFGGSKFAIEAKNERGRIITRRTLKLAGDPIFMSEVFEARWRKSNGLKPKKPDGEGETGGMSQRDLMALVEEKAASLRADNEAREERRRKEDADREEKNRREEREWRERVEKDKADRELRLRSEEREHRERMETQRREDDKRREDQRRDEERAREARMREDEARREKDHERQLQLATASAERAQKETQTFFTNMLAMSKQEGGQKDPLEMATTLVSLATALKGGDTAPKDAVTAFLEGLPDTLREAGNVVRQARGEAPAGGGGGGGEGEEGEEDANAIKLTGPVAAKMRELVTHLVKKGKDPRIVLSQAADAIMGKPGARERLAAAAAAKGSESAAPAKLPAKKRRRPKVKAKARAAKVVASTVKAAPVKVAVVKPAGAP